MAMVLSGDGTITGLVAGGLPDATITTDELAAGAALNNAPNSVGFRNRIINGDMRIAQRGTAAVTTSATFPVDRWRQFMSGGGVITGVQDSDVPNSTFQYSTKLTATTADASIAAADFYAFNQDIEGFNTADLGFGTAAAKTVTLSFWVRSSITGTYAVALYNSGGTRGYPATYTISAADTWTFVSLTIPGDTGGTWLTTNGLGITIRYDLGTGSNGNGTANTWNTSGTFAASRTSSTVNWIGTLNATFYLTGVQLEVGSVATPFERRDWSHEVIMCQRYYETGSQNYNIPYALSGTQQFPHVSFKVIKRAAATVTIPTAAANAVDVTSPNPIGGAVGFEVYGWTMTSTTQGNVVFSWTASAEL
jgi:hypothetical protein